MSLDNKVSSISSQIPYFGNVSMKYCEPKRGIKRTFHETIQGKKDSILNLFASHPYYHEEMPLLMKNSRGTVYYRKIIRNGLERKSTFFMGIMKAIKDLNEDNSPIYGQEKPKQLKFYRIPKLELLRKRREKLDLYLQKKNKTTSTEFKPRTLKKINSSKTMLNIKKQPSSSVMKSALNNSTMVSFINNNNSEAQLGTFLTNNNKTKKISKSNNINNSKNDNDDNDDNNENNGNDDNDDNNDNNDNDDYNNNDDNNDNNNNENNAHLPKSSSSKSLMNPSKQNKYFNSTTRNPINKTTKIPLRKSPERTTNYRTLQLGKLLNKCNEQLNNAQSVGINVENYNKNNNKSEKEIKEKIRSGLQNKDQKIIEDMGTSNKKYKKLEKEKFNELKKKMNIIKVSEDYAYINRKELHEFMRDNENILAYEIYLKEMNKINDKISKKKEVEKKNLSMVENLLEDVYRKKEFLKYKIDNYHFRHAKQDELKIFSLKNRDDFYMNKINNDKKVLHGTLLPKLIELKDYCYGRPKYNQIRELDNNIKSNSKD